MVELLEGMAKCVFNEKMEQDLVLGEISYIREIPNMRGHCIVLRNNRLPLVGIHIDRFEILSIDELYS